MVNDRVSSRIGCLLVQILDDLSVVEKNKTAKIFRVFIRFESETGSDVISKHEVLAPLVFDDVVLREELSVSNENVLSDKVDAWEQIEIALRPSIFNLVPLERVVTLFGL